VLRRNRRNQANLYLDRVKLANDITYKRMTQTMKTLQSLPSSQNTTLIRILFGHSKPHLKPQSEIDKLALKPVNLSLDASQLSAIKFALSSSDVALIHGPPGTGKTTTLVEIILQLAIHQNKRVLVCAASNIAVDNLVERLSHHPVPIVRLGHPARVLPQVVSHSLDALSKSSDAGEIVRDVRKELDDKTAELLLPRKKGGKKEDRRGKWSEVRELRKDYRERERRAVDEVVRGSKVVLATLHGSGGRDLKGERFDVLIVDEASQALEAQIWVALLGTGSSSSNIQKLILAGDHLQLPPTIKSTNSSNASKPKSKEKSGTKGTSLETTLFDRLLKLHGTDIKRMLTTQYRMHASIMAFPSAELYESKLVCGPGVEARLLTELDYEVADVEDTKEPLVFWDTQGGDFPELVSTAEEAASKDSKSIRSMLADSKSNPSEALLVRHHVRNLVAAGVKPEDIAVITPYNAQLAIIGGLLKEEFPTMEMGSVDGFQGREKEAVIVSLVRSGEGDVGFLADSRRLNGEHFRSQTITLTLYQ
jgi:DNA polymerase alpha-associated DNA helicase A